MSWEKELEEKVSREKLSENLGGKDRIKKQHDAGPVSYTHLTLPTT